jgi:hypothetical protein
MSDTSTIGGEDKPGNPWSVVDHATGVSNAGPTRR